MAVFQRALAPPVRLRCNLDWGASLLRLVEGRFKLFPQAQRTLMTQAAADSPICSCPGSAAALS